MGLVVEAGEIAGAHVDRTDREAHLARVDSIEVDQPLERGLERGGIVPAGGPGGAGRLQVRRRHARDEKARLAAQQAGGRAHPVEGAALVVALQELRQDALQPVRAQIGGDRLPELGQPLDPLVGRVAGDDGAVDGTDRDPRHPVGVQVRLRQRLIDASLVGAQGAAALEEKSDHLERRALLDVMRLSRLFSAHGRWVPSARNNRGQRTQEVLDARLS